MTDPDARNAEIADELREVIVHLKRAVDLLDPATATDPQDYLFLRDDTT